MQVASDAFSLGNFRQMLDLFVRLAQPSIHAVALGEESISTANQDGKNRRIKIDPKGVRVLQKCRDRSDAADQGKTYHRFSLRRDTERQHGSGINKERARTGVNGLKGNS